MPKLPVIDFCRFVLCACHRSPCDASGEGRVRPLDEKALQRILGNILNNAAKYAQGDLAVTLDPEGVITFSNRAKDLSRIDAGRLFDRFYTVENARGSTGPGLSIARLLTEKMGGRIDAAYENGCLTLCVAFREEGFSDPRTGKNDLFLFCEETPFTFYRNEVILAVGLLLKKYERKKSS